MRVCAASGNNGVRKLSETSDETSRVHTENEVGDEKTLLSWAARIGGEQVERRIEGLDRRRREKEWERSFCDLED